MKKLFFGALSLLAIVSCSQDETIEVNRSNDVIEFGVVANTSTRANATTGGVYCSNNLPGSFKVWAKHDGKTYIDGDVIAKSGDPVVWNNTTATRYWPAGNVDFYAYVNDDGKFAWNKSGAPTIVDYTVDTNVANQNDLIYAVKQADRTAAPVVLNFRHALSQIVFQAKNTNARLRVEIDGVTVCNVANQATFTFPEASSFNTDGNVANHDGTGSTTIGEQGEWTSLNGGNIDYPVTFTKAELDGVTGNVSLTSTNDGGKEYSSNALLLLPHNTTTAWDVTSAAAKPNPGDATQTGTYFLVKCAIYNVSDFDGDEVCLWGEKVAGDPVTYTTKNIAIPASFTWEQGKKYVYTFVFGEGNGGYNPDPTDPKPEPVLSPITFEVTVDDFVPVAGTDVDVDEP